MNNHQPDVHGLIAAQTAVGVQQEARISELEGQVLARDQQVLEDGRTIVNQNVRLEEYRNQLKLAQDALNNYERDCNDLRIKVTGAQQILERLQHSALPVDCCRRVDHWLANATPSAEERLLHYLTRQLVRVAVAWSTGEGVTLEDLQQAAHQLRAAGEA